MPCVLQITWITSLSFRATGIFAASSPRFKKWASVSVVSTLQTQPPMVADELRRQADQFYDLASLEDDIGRYASQRPPRDNRSYQGVDPTEFRKTTSDLDSASQVAGRAVLDATNRQKVESSRSCSLFVTLHVLWPVPYLGPTRAMSNIFYV